MLYIHLLYEGLCFTKHMLGVKKIWSNITISNKQPYPILIFYSRAKMGNFFAQFFPNNTHMHYIMQASFYLSRGAKATRPSINEWLYFEWHLRKANGEWKTKWDQLHIMPQCLEKIWQPLLVRLTSNRLLNLIGILGWGVGFIPPNAFSWIKKDGDLVGTIHISKVGDAKPFKVAWEVWNWSLKFNKEKWGEKMHATCKYHELEMIYD